MVVCGPPAGGRAANIMSLIESAKPCGHDSWAYLKDVFERLTTLKTRDLDSTLPHNWRALVQAAERVGDFAAMA